MKGALYPTLLFHNTAGVPFIKRLKMESKCVVACLLTSDQEVAVERGVMELVGDSCLTVH